MDRNANEFWNALTRYVYLFITANLHRSINSSTFIYIHFYPTLRQQFRNPHESEGTSNFIAFPTRKPWLRTFVLLIIIIFFSLFSVNLRNPFRSYTTPLPSPPPPLTPDSRGRDESSWMHALASLSVSICFEGLFSFSFLSFFAFVCSFVLLFYFWLVIYSFRFFS